MNFLFRAARRPAELGAWSPLPDFFFFCESSATVRCVRAGMQAGIVWVSGVGVCGGTTQK